MGVEPGPPLERQTRHRHHQLVAATLRRRGADHRCQPRMGVLPPVEERHHAGGQERGVDGVGERRRWRPFDGVERHRLEDVAVLDHRSEAGADACVGIGRHDRLGVLGEAVRAHPCVIEDRRAAGVQHLQRARHRQGVAVVGTEGYAAVDHPDEPQVEGEVRCHPAVQVLARVGVGVDQPRHGDQPVGVEDRGRPGGQMHPDLGDGGATNEHVGLAQRATGIEDRRPFDQQLGWCHGLGAPPDPVVVDQLLSSRAPCAVRPDSCSGNSSA